MSLITAPATSSRRIYGKYAPYPGNADLVYDAICKVLSERKDQVNWEQFGAQEWQLFVQMAETEGVGPLLHWKAKGGRMKDELPSAVQQQLKSSYYQTAAQNAVLFQELDRILAAFAEAEIPVIVLKGAALAQTLYPDPGLRPMGDLDLLIQRSDIPIAKKIMENLNYEEGIIEACPWLANAIGNEVNFYLSGNNPVLVELHWALISYQYYKFRPETTWFWHQKTKLSTYITKKETAIYSLSELASFFYSLGHLAIKHQGEKGKILWYYDLYLFLRNNNTDFDWDQLLFQVNKVNWENDLNRILSILISIFGDDFPIPKRIIQQLDHDIDAVLIQNKQRNTIRIRDYSWKPWLIIYFFALLFPSPKYVKLQYRSNISWMWPLNYLQHWKYAIEKSISRFML